MQRFTAENFHALCDDMAARDRHLQAILTGYGYPPFWTRPNTYETLVLTILEQQVSLASAYAAYKKLKAVLPEVTPEGLLSLNDETLRSCSFTRQKMVYVRELATAIQCQRISLEAFETAEDNVVRRELKALKGIGDWTVDIYLLHALQRTDIFPLGDLALVNAVQMIREEKLDRETIKEMAEAWRPYRTLATMLFWHYYICKKKIRLLH